MLQSHVKEFATDFQNWFKWRKAQQVAHRELRQILLLTYESEKFLI